MIKIFTIWRKKIEDLTFEDRRSKLKEFSKRGIDDGETYEAVRELLDEEQWIFAGEFFYYSAIYAVSEKKELPDVRGLVEQALLQIADRKTRLIVEVLFFYDIKVMRSELRRYFVDFKKGSELYGPKKRYEQVSQLCQEVIPYICFSEASDNLFLSLYLLDNADRIYSKLGYLIVDTWVSHQGSTSAPMTEQGKLTLKTLIYLLISHCAFPGLNRIHFYFPTLTEDELYGESFESFISRVPQRVIDMPNSAIYFLNSFKRAYDNSKEGYEKWYKWYESTPYFEEKWFQALAYLEYVNIDVSILDIPDNTIKQSGKEKAPANKLDYEVLEIFMKVMEECPQNALTFLRKISAINAFEYNNKPQIYEEKVKKPLKRLYLSKAFMTNYDDILLKFFSVRDFFIIYINSPLSQVSRLDEVMDRLGRRGIKLDISETPMSQVIFKGFFYYHEGAFFFSCPKLSEKDLKVTNFSLTKKKEYEILKNSPRYKRSLITAYLDGYVSHESVELVGVSIVKQSEQSEDDYSDTTNYLRKKRVFSINRTIEIYEQYEEGEEFDKKGVNECLALFYNWPRPFDYNNSNFEDRLNIALVKAFLNAASDEGKLLDIVNYTSNVLGGRLNDYFYDPFGMDTKLKGRNGFDVAKLAELLGDDSDYVFNRLSDKRVTKKALITIYFHSIIKRILRFEQLIELLKLKSDKNASSKEILGDVRSLIVYGNTYYYDQEKSLYYINPQSFLWGGNTFVTQHNENIEGKQDFFFVIDDYDEEGIIYAKNLSTKEELINNISSETFRAALIAATRPICSFSNAEIRKILSCNTIQGLFAETWYVESINSYFCYHILNNKELLDAIELIENNNLYSNVESFDETMIEAVEQYSGVYREYFLEALMHNAKQRINSFAYIYMNSPIKLVFTLNELIEEFVSCYGSAIDLIAELMQYRILAKTTENAVIFLNVICNRYRIDGNNECGEYHIVDYDAEEKCVVFKASPNVTRMVPKW